MDNKKKQENETEKFVFDVRECIGRPVNDTFSYEYFSKYINLKFDYDLIVLTYTNETYEILFKSESIVSSLKRNTIYLLRSNSDTYHVVKKPNLIQNTRDNFCFLCNRQVKDLFRHNCGKRCSHCDVLLELHNFISSSKTMLNTFYYCNKCNRNFYSLDCLNLHNTFKTCEKFIICSCGKKFCRLDNVHKCDLRRQCFQCNEIINPIDIGEHHCFVNPLELTREHAQLPSKICFFDIESVCCSNDKSKDSDFQHQPNLLCCVVFEITSTREVGAYNEVEKWSHFGFDCVDLFVKKFLTPNSLYDKTLFISHGGSGYDNHFIVQRGLCCCNIEPTSIVLDGSKILSVSYGGIKKWRTFIDSYKFIPTKLSSFPKMFGFSNDDDKLTFPIFFNQPQFFNYRGQIPAKVYYGYESMTIAQKETFDLWYECRTRENYVFDFAVEISKYCYQDVVLLAKGCLTYRDIFLKIVGVECFTKNILTLPSLTLKILRSKYLAPKRLENIGPVRKGSNIRAGKQAISYLDWLNLKRSNEMKIFHRDNSVSGEVKFGKYSIDGYCPGDRTVFEYDSCYAHGCTCIQNQNRDAPMTVFGGTIASSLNQRHERTERKKQDLEKWGFKVEQIRPCKTNIPLAEIKLLYTPRINFEEGLIGGRCEAFLRYASIGHANCQSISYGDFVSLYPYSCMQNLPLGPMKIIRPKAEQLIVHPDDILNGKFFGLIHCVMLAPEGLFIPVLPYKALGKTFFALCRKCLENPNLKHTDTTFKQSCVSINEHKNKNCSFKGDEYISVCPHTEASDRAFTSLWTTMELSQALKVGYHILDVYEIFDFPENGSELFNEYVKTFFALKVGASGFPKDDMSDSEKEAYVEEIRQRDGLDLTVDEVVKNSGIRAVSKLCLNSLWGRLCLSNKRKTEYVSNWTELQRLLNDHHKTVKSFDIIGKDKVRVQYEITTEFWDQQSGSIRKDLQAGSPYNSIPVAAMVTSYARIRLYEYMSRIDPKKICYVDTDSIIYYNSGEKEDPLPYGESLGDFSSEIQNDRILSVVCGGSKQYAYRTEKGKEVIKIRGITWNREAEEQINFDLLHKLVDVQLGVRESDGSEDVKTINYPSKIKRDSLKYRVFTSSYDKKYRLIFNKRVIIPRSYHSYPIGYRKLCICNKTE